MIGLRFVTCDMPTPHSVWPRDLGSLLCCVSISRRSESEELAGQPRSMRIVLLPHLHAHADRGQTCGYQPHEALKLSLNVTAYHFRDAHTRDSGTAVKRERNNIGGGDIEQSDAASTAANPSKQGISKQSFFTI